MISAQSIPSAEAFGVGTVSAGSPTLLGIGIPSAEAFGGGTVSMPTPTALTVAPTARPSTDWEALLEALAAMMAKVAREFAALSWQDKALILGFLFTMYSAVIGTLALAVD